MEFSSFENKVALCEDVFNIAGQTIYYLTIADITLFIIKTNLKLHIFIHSYILNTFDGMFHYYGCCISDWENCPVKVSNDHSVMK